MHLYKAITGRYTALGTYISISCYLTACNIKISIFIKNTPLAYHSWITLRSTSIYLLFRSIFLASQFIPVNIMLNASCCTTSIYYSLNKASISFYVSYVIAPLYALHTQFKLDLGSLDVFGWIRQPKVNSILAVQAV